MASAAAAAPAPAIRRLIERLQLRPHPEGGYYAETFRARETIAHAHLPARFGGDRCHYTAIYFLLDGQDFSAFHRIHSDEIWHFYQGCALHLEVLHSDGRHEQIRLGTDLEQGARFQAMVPAGAWFAARPAQADGFALVGCTVAGFRFRRLRTGADRHAQRRVSAARGADPVAMS